MKDRIIKIHYFFPGNETKEVTLQEAKKFLNELYNHPSGGFAIDIKTRKIIREISDEVEEILIIYGIAEGG
jgi:hypothetical protein